MNRTTNTVIPTSEPYVTSENTSVNITVDSEEGD
jgi:hypothetical protein